MTVRTPRVVVLVDSDSYVKWGASFARRVPPTWHTRLVIARGTAEPTPRQIAEALDGTGFAPADVEVVSLDGLTDLLARYKPDVFVAAARGLTVQTALELAMPTGPQRPVIVTGLPGIAVPVLPYGLGFRRGADLFVVHSQRELREFKEASHSLGITHWFALATLPFLPRKAEPSIRRDSIVFAAQAMVPETRADRHQLIDWLIETANQHPDLRVVIKVRARPGEPQTHDERYPFMTLLDEVRESGRLVPDNLVVESGPMAAHLARAVGLVTVSSTALLEAIAMGVPVLALNDFGVDARQINLVFADSGVMGSSTDLVAAHFRQPQTEWLADNYFHDEDTNDWIDQIERLMVLREHGGLPPLERVPRTLLHRARMIFYRNLAFSQERTSLHGAFERAVVWISLKFARSEWVVTRRFKPTRASRPESHDSSNAP